MRTPSWEASGGALAAFLNSAKPGFLADLYTVTSAAGVVLARWTNADIAVSVAGYAYAAGPLLTRGKTTIAVGVTVDTLDVKLSADATVTINGVPLLKFIASGGLDNARLTLERAYAAGPVVNWLTNAWIGTLPLFSGRVSQAVSSRYEATLTVSSDLELLDVMIPRNVYQPGCGNTLFDGACGLAKSSYGVTATVTSGTGADKNGWVASALAQASGYFALGWAVGLTGANAGVGRTVKAFASGALLFINAWPAAVGVGDTFMVYPGCDKSMGTCTSKFANVIRFRGQPFVPPPETVL